MAKGKRDPAVLTPEARTFVVIALACFDTPSEVAKAVKAEFDITVKPQSVEKYDPTKRAGRGIAPKWRGMFEAAREKFLKETGDIAISHRAVRLRAIQRMAEKAETMGNMVLAKDLLKQAAEEMGNAYTNRRELTGKDGKDLPAATAPVTIFQLPDNGRG